MLSVYTIPLKLYQCLITESLVVCLVPTLRMYNHKHQYNFLSILCC